jgi:hypothetical protein
MVRNYESPIGNIVADAMYTKLRCAYNSREAFYVSLVNVGAIRTGLPAGPLPWDTSARILPFGGDFVIGTIDGTTLQQALEVAVSQRGSGGSFLATQGVQFLWDPTRRVGERITRCRVFAYGQSLGQSLVSKNCMDVSEIFLGTNDYIASGGGGFDSLKGLVDRMLPLEPCVTYQRLGSTIQEILGEHLKLTSPLLPAAQIGIQGRIEKIYRNSDSSQRAEELRVDSCCVEQCGVGQWLVDAMFRYAQAPSNKSVALLPCDLLKRPMEFGVDDNDWTDYKFVRMLALYLQGKGLGAEKVFYPAAALEIVSVSIQGRHLMAILERLLEVDHNQPQLLNLAVAYDPQARSQCRVMKMFRGATIVDWDESLLVVTTRKLLNELNSSIDARETSIRTAGTEGNGNLLLAIESALQANLLPTNQLKVAGSASAPGFVVEPAMPLNPECTLKRATAEASIQSRSAILQVGNPGLARDWLTLRIRAMGQIAFNATISVVVALKQRGRESEVLRKQADLDGGALSAFGQHIFVHNFSTFVHVPLGLERNMWQIDMPLRFGVNCQRGADQPCAADGDTIETALRLSSADGAELMAESVVTVEVMAVPSCDRMKLAIGVQPDKLLFQSGELVRIRILAMDAADAPISYTRLDSRVLRIRWDGATLPFTWSHSNEYRADIPAAFTQHGGEYELVVTILQTKADPAFVFSQNATFGEHNLSTPDVSETFECTLLKRMVSIEEKKQVVLISVVAVSFGLLLLLLAYLVHRNRGHVRELLLSFARFEGLLAVDMCFDVLNVSGHAFFVRELQLSRSKPWVADLLVPNAVLFAISCVVAVAVVGVKFRFFAGKLQTRNFSTRATQLYAHKQSLKVGDIAVSRELSEQEGVQGLRTRFEVNLAGRRIIYCQLFAALLQDTPMLAVRPAPALPAVTTRYMPLQCAACCCFAP